MRTLIKPSIISTKALISNFKEEGYYYSALGFYHLNVGNTAEAIDALKRSINLLNMGDFDTKNVHSYFLLQDIYYNQGRYREAYDALMAFSETYTRQHNRQGVVELSKLLSDLEVERAEQEHLRREEEYQRQQDYNKMISIFYVLSIFVIMALVFLLLSRFRLERKNRELQRAQTEQELNHKNEIIKIQKLQQYQEQNNIDKKRIAKNTFYLYIRMLLLLGVNFFAVRLVLNILGVDDYGIFELIFGFVVMFMTLNAALTGMVHRFLCYEKI